MAFPARNAHHRAPSKSITRGSTAASWNVSSVGRNFSHNDMSKKQTVIHHSADFDGIFCREVARHFIPDAELIGWDFNDRPLAVPECDALYVLDLPLDAPFGFKWDKEIHSAKCFKGEVIWIDHHKSAIESHPDTIRGLRIDGVAACRLAWQWFTEETQQGVHFDTPNKTAYVNRAVKEPLAVRLAGEYDIWDKRDPRAEIFQFGLRSRELTASDWRNMLSREKPTIEEVERLISVGHEGLLEPDGTVVPAVVCQLLDEGKLLQAYQQRNDAGMMHRSFIVEWEGLKFLALTTARCNSLTFASKDVPETGHDALMGFYYNGTGWTVSLYHAAHRTDLDLSQIAVKHGGGGHRGACGFRTNTLPFVKN